MNEARQFTRPITEHGEGPFWDEAAGLLLVVDMLRGDVLALDEEGEEAFRHHVGDVAAAVRARRGGGYVVAVENGFIILDAAFNPVGDVVRAFDDPSLRMNDGGCDPWGRFHCGTMAYAETPGRGTLYRLDADRTVHEVLHGVTISNGLQWSADGLTAYYSDTGVSRVDVFDVDPLDGAFLNRRPFIEFDGTHGRPDGLALDAAGGLWVALWGGSAVHHFDANGHLLDVVKLPVRNVTACTFGGAEGRTLFITTSRLGLGDSAEPEAGAVFAVDTDVVGAHPHTFAG